MGQPTQNNEPRTVGDDIEYDHDGDHAAFLAALLGLPRDLVATKLTLVRPGVA